MDGGYPAEPTETENLNGTVGTNAAYTPKTGGAYEGFTYKSALTKVNNTVQTEGTINADSSTVVELYYERNTVNVTFKLAGGNVSGNTADIIKTGKYGTALTAPAPEREGYAFKGWSPAPPSPLAFPAINTEYTAQWKINKYPITFSVEGENGTLKATVGGSEITSGNTVEHGKTVTFTATPAAGYRIKEWKLGEEVIAEAGTNTEYTLTVTKPAAVTVSFEPKKALLTLEAGKNTVKVKAKTADGKPITVKGCNETELLSDAETTLTVTATDNKLALIGDIIELNCSGDNNVGGNRPLAELDVSGLTALQKLNCQFNKITALNVQGLTELQELYCRTNQIPELNVHGLTKLQKLNCIGNELTALDVQGCTPLQKLICNDNQLTALDVQGLNALQVLNCRSNKLTSLNAQGLTALQELICKDNQLKTLNVSDCTALQELNCQTNKLTSLNVQGLTALQELECGDNQLAELNVQGCTSLKSLLCFRNKLNVDAFTKLFNDLPTREISDRAWAIVYMKGTNVTEGNCTDFTTPETLKKAFEDAKNVKHWKMQKANNLGIPSDI
ncbi:leucine-rich repeat domain-containing protein [Treponema sp. OMZ 305]|nr:leucine-rich repeat domain-containing protein [Treponema sp. OMZ 305]